MSLKEINDMQFNKNGLKSTIQIGSLQLSAVGLGVVAVGLVLTFVLK